MKLIHRDPPREFEVGLDKKTIIKDCGSLFLNHDEQLTLKTETGSEYDVTRKPWGFYATPSTNGRLAAFGLRAILVKNRVQRYFVLLVEKGFEREFKEYLKQECLDVVLFLDDPTQLEQISGSKLMPDL